ncbi:MAG: hypothetical protein ACRCYY_16095 [Trueperaceae bacterium]
MQRLVQTPSVNPSLESIPVGEKAVAHFVATWCKEQGLEVMLENVTRNDLM